MYPPPDELPLRDGPTLGHPVVVNEALLLALLVGLGVAVPEEKSDTCDNFVTPAATAAAATTSTSPATAISYLDSESVDDPSSGVSLMSSSILSLVTYLSVLTRPSCMRLTSRTSS